MKKLAILAVLLICAIIVTLGAIMYVESCEEDSIKKINRSTTTNEELNVVRLDSNTNENSNSIVLKEVQGGFIEVNSNTFYTSRDVREIGESRALIGSQEARILY